MLRDALRFLLESASLGSGFIPLYHARRDTSTLTDRDPVVFRPSPHIAAALTVGGGAG